MSTPTEELTINLFTPAELRAEFEALRQATQKVTPGPWHRISTVVMKRTTTVKHGAPQLPVRLERRIEDPDDFWEDVDLPEHSLHDASRRTSGWIGQAEREEDADHFARCDREMFMWLIDDFERRLDEHEADIDPYLDPVCRRCGENWPCDEVLAAEQFVVHAHME